MIEEVLPNLYRLEAPLPNNPLKAINSYVIKGHDRNLMVDTGMNREECLTALTAGLQELEIKLEETDFFVTHMHADHSGLVAQLSTKESKIYCGDADALVINHGIDWEELLEHAQMTGFPAIESREAINRHPGYKYSGRGKLNIYSVKDNDRINVGDYTFQCIETPGHTYGHVCLYEPEKKILISGDHILSNITPNIFQWLDDDKSMEDYLSSLDKVYHYDVKLVLPGHRRIIYDHRERIDELKEHHQIRNNEILELLNCKGKTAYQVASEMQWDLTYKTWGQFPIPQKWFATGEANAHLKYLEGQGLVNKSFENSNFVYRLP